MNTLEVVRAGAGSGKTTDLCNTVADAVVAGLDPARILATTFTKKAAAELKSRIQAKLLSADGDNTAAHKDADRLELAAVGTVHGVAHQLLARYAIDLGLSPRLEVIEQGSHQALRDLLGSTPIETWQPLAECAERLGIDELHTRVLKLLEVKRGNRISDAEFTTHMVASAVRVCELLSPSGPVGAEATIDQLFAFADQALENIDALQNDTTKTTIDARRKLRQLKSSRVSLWGCYLDAAKIKAGKKSGADAMLDPLRLHAGEVRRNSRLHSDIREFAALIATETIRIDDLYVDYKSERGLVDFTDLEVLLLGLLEDEELSERLAKDFDLVLVDEFQDTNPLQLAIFQRLRKLVRRNRWVGDPKQAIYGFRDTDPQLVNSIWERSTDDERTELPNNHRSQRGLVQLVGELFSPALGEEARQVPQRPQAPRGVERWIFDSKNNKNKEDDFAAIANGIAELYAEGIRFGDIAVLERQNMSLVQLSAALDAIEIPYLLESPGLFSTREGALLSAGLRLVADRSDSLAAATILHLLSDPTKDTPQWIIERLTDVQRLRESNSEAANSDPPSLKIVYQKPWEDDPLLECLGRIDRTLLSPLLVMQNVIEALNLPILIQKWGETARRCSNLDSALTHTHEYEELAFKRGEAATLSGLILYLEQLAAYGADMRYTSQGHDAVTLMSYHGSKGLEWPVVILSGLNESRLADMWSPVVTGGATVSDSPLDGRVLRSWTWPFGKTDGPFGRIRTGSNLEDDALNSPEGAERSERENNERLRLLYVGCTRAKQKLVLAHRDGKYDWLQQLPTIDALLDPTLDAGEHPLEDCDTTFVIRRLDAEQVVDLNLRQNQSPIWISSAPLSRRAEVSPRFHSPSQVEGNDKSGGFEVIELPGKSFFPESAHEPDYAAIGNAVHAYLASIPSMRSLNASQKQRVAERCLSAYSVTGLIPTSVIVTAGERFSHWVESCYPGATWHVEIPVSSTRKAGGQWVGAIDLVLQLPDGNVVIIDHKSSPIRREHCANKAAEYVGQLSAYEEILGSSANNVRDAWIHFPLAGVVARKKDNL